MRLDYRELSTVLAALRFWQSGGRNLDDILDIATDGGEIEMLTADEIDELCERINCTPENA